MKENTRVSKPSDPFPIKFKYNHAVAKGNVGKNITLKKRGKPPVEEWWKEDSVRRKDGTILDKPIQIYRRWFLFLKLALELEDMGVTLILKQSFNRETKLMGFDKKRKVEKLRSMGSGDNIYIYEGLSKKIKVDRKKYQGWDLDQVLKGRFDPWWKEHMSLFRDEGTVVLNTPDEWVVGPYYQYVRIDTRRRMVDTVKDVKEILGKKNRNKVVQSQFPVYGKHRPDNLLNYYNALVLRLGGKMSAKEIFLDDKRYLRPSGDLRIQGGKYKLPVNKNGKEQYSRELGRFLDKGKEILLNVCGGYFSKRPPKGSLT